MTRVAVGLVLVVLLSSTGHGQALYRLGVECSDSCDPGQSVEFRVWLDNISSPDQSAGQACALSWGFHLHFPPELTVITGTTDETDAATAMSGQNPLFCSLTTLEQEVRSIVVLGAVAGSGLAEGGHHTLLRVSAVVAPGATLGAPFEVTLTGGTPGEGVPLHVGSASGTFVPHTVAFCSTIGAQPSSSPPLPAEGSAEWIVVRYAANPAAPAEEAAPAGATVVEVDGAQASSEAIADPIELLGLGAGSIALACDPPVTGGDPYDQFPPDVVVALYPEVDSHKAFSSLQEAVDYGATLGQSLVSIMIRAGTFVGPTVIDTDALGTSYMIYSQAGPQTSILQGAPGSPVVSLSGSRKVVLGWVDSSIPGEAGWRGMRITGGSSGTGGGVRIVGMSEPNLIWGNIIDENGTLEDPVGLGGGIFASDCGSTSTQLRIEQNRISNNVVAIRGGGIYAEGSFAYIGHSLIEGNGFGNTPLETPAGPVDIESVAEGGGVALYAGAGTALFDVSVCQNEIRENEARVGGGLWALSGALQTVVVGGIGDVPILPVPDYTNALMNLHVERNSIHDNRAWVPAIPVLPPPAPGVLRPPWAGAGMAIQYHSQDPGGDPRPVAMLEVLNNDVFDNIMFVDSVNAPGQIGGGFYLVVKEAFAAASVIDVTGNFFASNLAYQGGGVWADVTDIETAQCGVVLVAKWYNDTIVDNDIAPYSPPVVPPTYSHGLYFATASLYDCRNNIVWNNPTLPVPADFQWHVQCVPHPCILGTGLEYWSHSVLGDQYPIAACPSVASWNLFSAANGDVALEPKLFETASGQDRDLRIRSELSVCIDDADPQTDGTLAVDDDNEGQDRYYDLSQVGSTFLDRGGDEHVRTPFIRGDANGDHAVNIADVVAILNQTATNCEDSRDADDDGSLDPSNDSMYLLNWLFGPGSPPPPPFLPDCGDDPFPYDELHCLDSIDPCP